MLSTLIAIAIISHLTAFVCYPASGRFGFTFLFVSLLLWGGLSAFLSRAAHEWKTDSKVFLGFLFTLACAFAALSFLPQKDGRSALSKFTAGKYPEKKDIYIGLLRLGVSVPALLPPAEEEKPL